MLGFPRNEFCQLGLPFSLGVTSLILSEISTDAVPFRERRFDVAHEQTGGLRDGHHDRDGARS
ncbi:protein of unknown function (plasmid) [Caballeronia sp. S22]